MTHLRAVLLLVGAAFFWSWGGFLIKWIQWHPMAIAGMRSALAAVVIFIAFPRMRFTWSRYQLLGAVAFAGNVILFVVATKMTTAANTVLLQYMAPAWVAVFAGWFLGEKTRRSDWFFLLIVISGMVLFFVESVSLTGFWGNWLAVASGFCFGWMTLFFRKQKDVSVMESMFLGNVLAGLIGLPFMFTGMPDLQSWVGLGILGTVQLGLPYIMFTIAIRHVRALEAMLVPMIEPVLNPIWAMLLVGEVPGIYAVAGGVVILGSVTVRSLILVFTTENEQEVEAGVDVSR